MDGVGGGRSSHHRISGVWRGGLCRSLREEYSEITGAACLKSINVRSERKSIITLAHILLAHNALKYLLAW